MHKAAIADFDKAIQLNLNCYSLLQSFKVELGL